MIFKSKVLVSYSLTASLIDFQFSQGGSSFQCQTPGVGCLVWGSTFAPWGRSLSLWYSSPFLSHTLGAWLLLFHSYQTPCSSFFIALVVKSYSASLQVILCKNCSICSCGFDVFNGGRGNSGLPTVFLLLILSPEFRFESYLKWASLVAQLVKNLPAVWET